MICLPNFGYHKFSNKPLWGLLFVFTAGGDRGLKGAQNMGEGAKSSKILQTFSRIYSCFYVFLTRVTEIFHDDLKLFLE